MEAALRKMDAMLASTVIAITNTLPGSANEGDLYLVGTLPTGVAAGWANRIARWRNSPAGWEAYQPMQGWIVTIVGESTNKVRRYNGTAWVALAVDVGAEPYAGIPAQTSFWSSTVAGVRTWVQLVAADITDLATTLANYLTKADPTFTGTLSGPRATLTDFGVLRNYNGDATRGAVYPTGITVGANNWAMIIKDDGTDARLNAATTVALCVGGVSKVGVDADEMNLTAGVALKQDGNTVIDASRNIAGTTLKGLNAAGTGIRPAVALADGTFDDQDAATFRGTISAEPVISDGTDLQYLDGWKTWRDFATSVRATVLTGLSTASSAAVAATDTVLQAIGKLQAQINTKAPLAGAEIIIHSDFGRSATTDVWQSVFTNNASSGLQFAANSVANGTRLRIDQLVSIPADPGAAYQLYLGPQLTGDQSPSAPNYFDILSPGSGAGECFGVGVLSTEIEFLGSGSSMIANVNAMFRGDNQYTPVVRAGSIPFDATQARTLDIRFNPLADTDYYILRNRVFRRNP